MTDRGGDDGGVISYHFVCVSFVCICFEVVVSFHFLLVSFAFLDGVTSSHFLFISLLLVSIRLIFDYFWGKNREAIREGGIVTINACLDWAGPEWELARRNWRTAFVWPWGSTPTWGGSMNEIGDWDRIEIEIERGVFSPLQERKSS